MTETESPPAAQSTGRAEMQALHKQSTSTFVPPAKPARNGTTAIGERGRSTFDPPPTQAEVNPESDRNQRINALFSDDAGKEAPPAKEEPATKEEANGHEAAPPDSSGLGDLELPGTPKEEVPPEEFTDTSPISKVRAAHKAQLQRARALEAELAELKKQYAVPAKDIEQMRAKLAENEQRLKQVDYTRTDEFKEKFVQPIADVLTQAYTDVSEMEVTGSDGNPRQGTKEDFLAIARLPLQAATSKAKEMFGDMASEVLAHRRAYVQNVQKRDQAVERAAQLSEESSKRQQEEQSSRESKLINEYKSRTTALIEKLPQYFKEKEGDAESNYLLRKGFALVERLSSDKKLTDDQRLDIIAHLNLRAAAMPRVALDLQRAVARVAELETKLKSYEASVPRGGTTGGAPKPKADSVESSIDSYFDKIK